MKKLLFTLFLFTQVVSAQNIWNVSGTITEASNGETMIGATILVKETSEGSITDLDGNFSLSVPANATLLVQNLGFEPQEYVVKSDGEFISIALKSDAVLLEEFVTVGYGTVKKKDLTGAVSIIDNEAIAKMKPVKVENALQGTVAGVNVTQQSGAPGAGLDIRIRGVSTNGDASPVVIIDGYQGDLSLLNPDDIESITVLKDAQAAIYGTVGANGIVLVTTKKGTKNTAARINFSSSFGWQKTSKTLDLLSADDYEMLLNESYLSNNGTPPSNLINTGYNTDWQGELFDVAPMQTYNIGVSGGTDNITYSIGGSHLDQDGIVGGDKSGFSRSTARINLGIDITKKLKFNTSLIYTNMKRKSISENGLGSVLFNAINMPATLSPTDANGDYSLAPSNLGIEIINPLAQIENTYNEYFLNKLNGTFGLDYQLLESLKVTTRIGFNTTNDRSKSFSKEVDYGGKVFDVTRSSVNEDHNQFNDYTFDAFLSYNKTFADKHTTSATLGTTVYKNWGIMTVIDNTQSSGINTSAKVAQMIKNADQTWGGSWIALDAPIDFSTKKLFKVKVYSPRVGAKMLFKLENISDGAINSEKELTTTVANAWEELTFDFSDINTAQSYQKIIIIFDNGTMGDGSANFTFLVDDIMQAESAVSALAQIDLPLTFEDTTINYQVTDFGSNATVVGEDPTDASNTIAMTTKANGAASWAGTTMGTALGFATAAPLTTDNSKISVRVYSPKAGIQVRLKGEDHNNVTLTVETEATITNANTWETLVFDFNNVAAGTNPFNPSTSFDKFSIFFDFGQDGDATVYYWDDVMFGSDAAALYTTKAIDALSVYPNPTTGLLNIDANDGALVSIYNITGQLQKQEILNAGQISLEELSTGIYFVNVNNQTSRVIKK